MPVVETVDGKKVRYNKWTNIEVTDETTNRDLLEQSRYGKDIEEFMEAEKELQRYMENLEREERTKEKQEVFVDRCIDINAEYSQAAVCCISFHLYNSLGP